VKDVDEWRVNVPSALMLILPATDGIYGDHLL
jgi:hypothetical protein